MLEAVKKTFVLSKEFVYEKAMQIGFLISVHSVVGEIDNVLCCLVAFYNIEHIDWGQRLYGAMRNIPIMKKINAKLIFWLKDIHDLTAYVQLSWTQVLICISWTLC